MVKLAVYKRDEKISTKFWMGSLKERDLSAHPGVHGKINVKRMLRN
jgi:hypothetical protein